MALITTSTPSQQPASDAASVTSAMWTSSRHAEGRRRVRGAGQGRYPVTPRREFPHDPAAQITGRAGHQHLHPRTPFPAGVSAGREGVLDEPADAPHLVERVDGQLACGLGQGAQGGHEPGPLLGRHAGDERADLGLTVRHHPAHQGAARVGQVQDDLTPARGVGPAVHETGGLQAVDHAHGGGGVTPSVVAMAASLSGSQLSRTTRARSCGSVIVSSIEARARAEIATRRRWPP